MKPLLIQMVGLPRSGKSTIARSMGDELGAPVVSGDAIRLALHGQRYSAEAEPMVRALKLLMVKALFAAGEKVVISDDTHVSRAARDFETSSKWDTQFMEVFAAVETCVWRADNTQQPDLVPVIREMAARFEPLGPDEERY